MLIKSLILLLIIMCSSCSNRESGKLIAAYVGFIVINNRTDEIHITFDFADSLYDDKIDSITVLSKSSSYSMLISPYSSTYRLFIDSVMTFEDNLSLYKTIQIYNHNNILILTKDSLTEENFEHVIEYVSDTNDESSKSQVDIYYYHIN